MSDANITERTIVCYNWQRKEEFAEIKTTPRHIETTIVKFWAKIIENGNAILELDAEIKGRVTTFIDYDYKLSLDFSGP